MEEKVKEAPVQEVEKVEIAKETLDKMREEYEQLLRANQSLSLQCAQMQRALTSQRYDYMFKILENSLVFPQEYINAVIKEIQAVFTPENPEEAAQEVKEEE